MVYHQGDNRVIKKKNYIRLSYKGFSFFWIIFCQTNLFKFDITIWIPILRAHARERRRALSHMKKTQGIDLSIFNRPGVAGAVLHKALLLIN